METRDAAQIQRVLRDGLAGAGEDVAAAYLYGSAARGSAVFHDIDAAILLRKDPPPTLDGLHLDLAAELERRLRLPVDLVILNTAPVDPVHRVLRDGILLLDRDPSLRIRFEVNARNAFFDLQPILARYRRTGGGVS